MNTGNEYEGKIVLVTGGAGCIGSNLCKKLAELNAKKVIILDYLSSAYEWNIPKAKNISFVKGSILDDFCLCESPKGSWQSHFLSLWTTIQSLRFFFLSFLSFRAGKTHILESYFEER